MRPSSQNQSPITVKAEQPDPTDANAKTDRTRLGSVLHHIGDELAKEHGSYVSRASVSGMTRSLNKTFLGPPSIAIETAGSLRKPYFANVNGFGTVTSQPRLLLARPSTLSKQGMGVMIHELTATARPTSSCLLGRTPRRSRQRRSGRPRG